jgi:hypothetical protein|nr:MAG TPA: hypothetical protein [Crassvirales sp.]
MSNDKRLERIGNKLRNNINNVVCKDVDKINLGFVSTNLFGSSYFYDVIRSCIDYDILLTDKEKEKIDVIFNTSEYGRYCFT